MPDKLVDGKSAFCHVMAWCRQAPSYYLNQRWLLTESTLAYGVYVIDIALHFFVRRCLSLAVFEYTYSMDLPAFVTFSIYERSV